MTRPARTSIALGVCCALVGALAGCGVTRGDDSRDLLMIIPNSPGGGYDLTGRDAVQVMEDDDITGGDITVENVVGAGGAVAMTELVGKVGDEHTLMTVGLGVVGLDVLLRQPVRPQRRHPDRPADERARGHPGARATRRTRRSRTSSTRGRPTRARWPSAAARRPAAPTTSSRCSWPRTVGIDPNDVNFVTYDGGGPLTSALLGKKIDAGFSGLPEFQGSIDSGELRVLAVSGEERYPDGSPFAEAPTLTESDVDLVFLNWRGVLAPPELSQERTDQLIAYFEEMHDTAAWQKIVEDNGWTDDFKTGDEFGDLHRRAGRTGVQHPRGSGAVVSDEKLADQTTAPQEQTTDRAQYGLAAVLALVGVYTIIDARGLNVGFGDPIGPRVFPYVIGVGDARCSPSCWRSRRRAATCRRPRRGRTSTSPPRPTG